MSGFLDRVVARALGIAPIAHRRRDPLVASPGPPRRQLSDDVRDGDVLARDNEPLALEPARPMNARRARGAQTEADDFAAPGSMDPSAELGETRRRRHDERDDVTIPAAPGLASSDSAPAAMVGKTTTTAFAPANRPPGNIDGWQRHDDGAMTPVERAHQTGDRRAVPPGAARGRTHSATTALTRDVFETPPARDEHATAPSPSRQSRLAARREGDAFTAVSGADDDADGRAFASDREGSREHAEIAASRVALAATAGADAASAYSLRTGTDSVDAARARDVRTRATHADRDARSREADDTLTINVSIGRIDVARSAPPVSSVAPAAASAPRASLADYLHVRERMRGR